MATAERLPLSRERIAVAALQLGDSDGLDALSMRKVGSILGVEAMSLYNHVNNKDDLLDAVGDLLYGEVLGSYEPDADGTWRDNARHLVETFSEVAMAHPNVVSVLLDRPIPSITKVLFLQQCYDLFVVAGYPTREAALAFNTVASWMTGYVRSELTMMRRMAEDGQQLSRDDVPEEFHGAIDFIECCVGWTPGERLHAGFEVVISGLENELEANGWAR